MELNFGRATHLERLPGYGEVLAAGYDLRPGEVIVVISNSGVNPVPIDVAMAAKQKGLYVVAMTSLAHTQSVESRHPSGKHLIDVADDVIDNCGVYGDATLEVAGTTRRCGPTSTIAGVLIIQMLTTATIDELTRRGITPPL